MNVPERIWRAYDVRGRAGTELTAELFCQMGRSLVEMLEPMNVQRIAVGRDARISSPKLHAAFVQGLLKGGMTVLDVGMVPTPVLYFAVEALGIDAGVIVTASHNPPGDNGLKIRIQDRLLMPPDFQLWKRLCQQIWPDKKPGTVHPFNVLPEYHQCLSRQAMNVKGLRVGIDAGSGVMGPTAVEQFTKLGANVTALHCEPDGRFPHHPADPTKPENLSDLKAAVLNGSLDIGFAFDGDGDRIGVVTREGQMLWGDVLMALCAQELLQFQRGCCVQDVKCSMMFTDVVTSLGGSVVTSATGYALVQQAMRDHNAIFGGEQSSHLCFADNYFGFDDGLYTAIRLLPTIENIDERVKSLPHYFSTPELRIPIEDTLKYDVMRALKEQIKDKRVVTLDGLRPEDDNGWALIRPSNTEAVLTVRVEGKSENEFRRWSKEVHHWLKSAGVPSNFLGDLL